MNLVNHFQNGLELDVGGPTDIAGAFQKVADLLGERRDLSEDVRSGIRDAFMERESSGTTAFGFGIAFPHVFCPHLKGVDVVVCRIKEGVEMGAFDGEPTKTLICVAAPESERDAYLALLKQVAQVTRETKWRKFIQQSSSAAAVLDVLVEASGG